MMHRNAVKPDRRPSIITTINAGFSIVNRHPWIVLVPLLLDLFFWLGPRISPQPMIDALLRQPDVPAWIGEGVEQRRVVGMPYDLRIDGDFLNFVGPLLGTIVIPSPPLPQATFAVGNLAMLLGIVVATNLVALLVSAMYWLLLGDAVRGVQRSAAWLGRIWKLFSGMAHVIVVWLGIALLVIVPFLVVAWLAALASPALGITVALFGIAVVSWMAFTAQFAFDALVLSDAKPIRALLGSVVLVRRWFWSAIGLYMLGSIIILGLRVVWQALASLGPLALLAAMVGSAYIGAGLAAAHLVFYRDRVQPLSNMVPRGE